MFSFKTPFKISKDFCVMKKTFFFNSALGIFAMKTEPNEKKTLFRDGRRTDVIAYRGSLDEEDDV